jgi:hypothetical protein
VVHDVWSTFGNESLWRILKAYMTQRLKTEHSWPLVPSNYSASWGWWRSKANVWLSVVRRLLCFSFWLVNLNLFLDFCWMFSAPFINWFVDICFIWHVLEALCVSFICPERLYQGILHGRELM